MAELEPSYLKFIANAVGTDSFEVVPLAGDASSRRYFRIVVQDKSYVLMLWEPFTDVDNYPFLSVQQCFKNHQVNVPEVIKISPELGVVLLEDLGDLTLERKFWENQNQSLVMPFYEKAIDELIKIHYLTAQDKQKTCTAFHIEFDTKKLLWEMNYGREHLLEKLGGIDFEPMVKEKLDRIFLDICEKLHQQPKFIAHRDYHSRNLMLKLGKMRVIDFQDARLGPIQYDLVSLIYDSYVNLSETSRRHIIEYYLNEARDYLGKTFSRQQFDETMRLQIIQRCFKACGSFSSFLNLRNDKRYIKYIQPTLKTVAQTLEEFSEYRAFSGVLQDYGLLEKKYEELCTP